MACMGEVVGINGGSKNFAGEFFETEEFGGNFAFLIRLWTIREMGGRGVGTMVPLMIMIG